MLPSRSSLDPWVASIFLAQEKEREANGVEMHSKLGCNTQQASPCCVTPSPGEGGRWGMNYVGMGGGGGAALRAGMLVSPAAGSHGRAVPTSTRFGSEAGQGFVCWLSG